MQVSFRAVTATGLVKGAAAMQGTSPVASAALGRAMVRDPRVTAEFVGVGFNIPG